MQHTYVRAYPTLKIIRNGLKLFFISKNLETIIFQVIYNIKILKFKYLLYTMYTYVQSRIVKCSFWNNISVFICTLQECFAFIFFINKVL